MIAQVTDFALFTTEDRVRQTAQQFASRVSDMATQDKDAQAVKENRMVSVQEATVRKTIGLALFALTSLRVYAKV